MSTEMSIETMNKILDTVVESRDIGTTTIRMYFTELLSKVFTEGEGLDGKRPFGVSDWGDDVYEMVLSATSDVLNCDVTVDHEFIQDLIDVTTLAGTGESSKEIKMSSIKHIGHGVYVCPDEVKAISTHYVDDENMQLVIILETCSIAYPALYNSESIEKAAQLLHDMIFFAH